MPEERERREPKYAEVSSVDVEMPEIGQTLDALVSRLGMTSAFEVYGEKVKPENKDNPVLLIFFENKDQGIREGKTPVAYYKHPTPKTDLAKFVRKYGHPKPGMKVRIVRNERGYWEIDL